MISVREREREKRVGNRSGPVRALALVHHSLWKTGREGLLDLEVGHRGELVPLDSLSAQVKVLNTEGDATQKVVLSQRLGTEHAQLKLSLF